MARDPNKYYPRPGIPKDSPLLKYLEEDAHRTGSSINVLIPVRLLQFYEGGTAPVGDSGKVPEYEKQQESSSPDREKAKRNALAFLSDDD